MSKYAKWIGGGLGWALGGPIGGIAGFALGALFDNAGDIDLKNGRGSFNPFTGDRENPGQQQGYRETQAGDFGISLVILSAAIMQADGKVMKSELSYVKQFLVRQFGEEKAKELLRVLKEVLEQNVSIRQVCLQIRSHMSHPMRLQLLHYLFGIANADQQVHKGEFDVLATISRYLGISQKDFMSISAMFSFSSNSTSTEDAYRILEVSKNASDDEIKTAYRKLAKKNHPDRVASLGEEFQKAAKEKFQKIQDAYEQIKKERGMN